MLLAFLGVCLSRLLNKRYLDGAASVGVGMVMTVVAVLLARESKGLLVGEGATSPQRTAIRRVASEDDAVLGIRRLVTMYFGPGALLVALDVQFRSQLDSYAVAAAIVRMEARIRGVQSETMYIYVEATTLAGATDVPAAANSTCNGFGQERSGGGGIVPPGVGASGCEGCGPCARRAMKPTHPCPESCRG